MQHTHYTSPFKKKTFPVSIVAEHVHNASNMGSLLRTADAFGVEKLVFCGEDLKMERRFKKTSRATEHHVNFSIAASAYAVIKGYKASNHSIIGLEITDNSVPLNHFKLERDRPMVLVIGSENYGISEDVLSLCDTIIHINMFGHNSSMNVSHAASIALYEITNQLMMRR